MCLITCHLPCFVRFRVGTLCDALSLCVWFCCVLCAGFFVRVRMDVCECVNVWLCVCQTNKCACNRKCKCVYLLVYVWVGLHLSGIGALEMVNLWTLISLEHDWESAQKWSTEQHTW